jgi:hypothetical protein
MTLLFFSRCLEPKACVLFTNPPPCAAITYSGRGALAILVHCFAFGITCVDTLHIMPDLHYLMWTCYLHAFAVCTGYSVSMRTCHVSMAAL